MSDSRSRFEAWTQESPDQLEIYTNGALKGEYCDLEMQYAWRAWQAAEADRRGGGEMMAAQHWTPQDRIEQLEAELAAAHTRADAMLETAQKCEAKVGALLTACNYAVLALAHASSRNELYKGAYETVSAAIDHAK